MKRPLVILVLVFSTTLSMAQDLFKSTPFNIPALEGQFNLDSFSLETSVNSTTIPKSRFTLLVVDLFGRNKSNDINMASVMYAHANKPKREFDLEQLNFREKKEKGVISFEVNTHDYNRSSFGNRGIDNPSYQEARRGLYYGGDYYYGLHGRYY